MKPRKGTYTRLMSATSSKIAPNYRVPAWGRKGYGDYSIRFRPGTVTLPAP